MDPLSLLAGALILGVGYLLGRIRRPARTPAAAPYCGCDHTLAMHDWATGQCHEQLEQEVRGHGNVYLKNQYVQCPCRQYTGPVPITDVWAPPLLPAPEGDQK